MNKTMRSRRGVTLAEIMVALALVSIMITMVVSFTMLITERTRANAANEAMRRDCEMIRAGAERWLDAAAAEAVAQEKTLTAFLDEGHPFPNFQGNSFVVTLPDGQRMTMRTENVTDVDVGLLYPTAPNPLLLCTVTCENPATGEEVAFKICVSSHLGAEGGL